MKARNKHTGVICEVYWEMCDIGRKCQASDKPIKTEIPCCDYNAVVDDYDFEVNGKWVDGLHYIKAPLFYEDRIINEIYLELARKQIASEIVQPYADKGFKCYEESMEAAKEDDSERSNEFYWDGFSDCATRILEELKATNKGE